jgi:hypothetical protein
MSVKAKTNLIVDIVILIAFLAANNPSLTGLPVHEWFAVAAGVVFLVRICYSTGIGCERQQNILQQTYP